MQQVVVIHGGTTFPSREDYLSYLEGKEFVLSDHSRCDWKSSLGTVLGEAYAVYTPSMPNKQDARYIEWRVWFEKILAQLDDDIVLVGHSLGGIFLAKYLVESVPARKIRATFFIAPPFFLKERVAAPGKEYIGDFVLPSDLSNIEKGGGQLRFYFSEDDMIVPIRHADQYAAAVPQAAVRTFKDRGHFLGEDFPELVQDIRQLS